MKEQNKYYDCKVCNTKKSVKFNVKETDYNVTQKVYKCTKCKHQYGIKGLMELNESEITLYEQIDIDSLIELDKYVIKNDKKVEGARIKGFLDGYIKGREQDKINIDKIKKLRDEFNVLFDQNTLLIKEKDEIESKYYKYKIKHPEYSGSNFCVSCGSNNCIC